MAALRFKLFDHPSDIGIIAFGKDRKEIFTNAAYGMFSLIGDLKKCGANRVFSVEVEGEDPGSLLINWLNELLYFSESKNVLLRDFKISAITDTELKAEVGGEKIDPQKHSIYRSIKAATYNQLLISKNRARIIFDI